VTEDERDERDRAIEANPLLRASRERAREALRKRGIVIVTRTKRAKDGTIYTEVDTIRRCQIGPGGTA